MFLLYEEEILKVYKKCNITGFPFDCIKVLTTYGYTVKTYIEASKSTDELRRLSRYSPDAFTDSVNKIVYYNDNLSHQRIRFSLMHEFGHIILNTDDDPSADRFAANILAPYPIVYIKHLKTAESISRFFDVSIAAANRIIVKPEWKYQFDLFEDDQELVKYFLTFWEPDHPLLYYTPRNSFSRDEYQAKLQADREAARSEEAYREWKEHHIRLYERMKTTVKTLNRAKRSDTISKAREEMRRLTILIEWSYNEANEKGFKVPD